MCKCLHGEQKLDNGLLNLAGGHVTISREWKLKPGKLRVDIIYMSDDDSKLTNGTTDWVL